MKTKLTASFRLVVLLCLISLPGFANDGMLILKHQYKQGLIGKHISYLEDKSNEEVVKSPSFVQSDRDIVNFNVSPSTFWLKLTIKNELQDGDNRLEVAQPLLEEIDLYTPDSNRPGHYNIIKRGQKYPFDFRGEYRTVNFIYDLDLKPGETKTFYIKASGYKQILLPLKVIRNDEIVEGITSRTLWFGIYCGIVSVMVFYNIFIFCYTQIFFC